MDTTDDPNIATFGSTAWAGHTNLNPIGIAALIILGLALLLLPRRYALLPILIMACLVAPGQRLVVLSMNFDMRRLMVFIGWVRVLTRGEATGVVYKPIDWAVGLFAVSLAFFSCVRVPDLQTVVTMMGQTYDCLGMYWLFRWLIRTWDDIRIQAICFAAVSIPVVIAFFYEHMTAYNIFSVFGYVSPITAVREGRLRCQGAFAHPILAGCFWASAIPLMAVYAWQRGSGRVLAAVGVLCSLAIIVLCASSTPVAAVMFCVIAALVYYVRNWLRWIRWGIVFSLIFLHLVMKSPVWSLVARIDLVGGSTGWDRYNLINQCIKHFSDWWFDGLVSTVNWGITDMCNQFVFYAVDGGIVTLALFILIIVLAFQGVGAAMRLPSNSGHRAVIWAMGVVLFAHVMNFLGVSYFEQIVIVWYLHLAIIAAITPAGGSAPSVHFRRGRFQQPLASVVRRVPSSAGIPDHRST